MLDKLQSALVRLLNDKSHVFYASLIMQMRQVEDESVQTMGVGMQDGRIYLYYNTKWMNTLNLDELSAVLEHECMHLIFEHPIREKGRDHTIWNIACDMAINQMIAGLPKDCIFPKNFKMPDGKIAELYYELLYKQATKIKINVPGTGKPGNGKGEGTGGYTIEIETPDGKKVVIDSHEKWKEMMKGDPSLNKEGVRQAIKDAYRETQKNRGFVPGNLEGVIKKWLEPPTLSWKQILRLYVGNTIKTGSKYTWKRVSRRYGTSQKGTLPTRTLKLVLGIDTSGSVGDSDFKEFVAEIKGIMNCYKNETLVIQSDAKVQDVILWKPGTPLEAKFKRHGYGGTDYEPVFKYLKEKQKDTELCIYLTDFYCSFPKEKPKFPVVWVVTSNGDMKNMPPYGKVIQIKKTNASGEEEGE